MMFEWIFKRKKQVEKQVEGTVQQKKMTQKNKYRNRGMTPLMVGAKLFQVNLGCMSHQEEKIIIETVGKGKLLEEQGRYQEAIRCYEEAEELTLSICADIIEQFKSEYPERPSDWDWLYLKVIRRRLRVCRKAIEKL